MDEWMDGWMNGRMDRVWLYLSADCICSLHFFI